MDSLTLNYESLEFSAFSILYFSQIFGFCLSVSIFEVNFKEKQQQIKKSSLSTNPNDVQFYLYYDPANPNATQRLVLNDTTGIRKAKFRRRSQVIFVTHGFTSGYNFSNAPAQILKNAYLSQNIVNIIAVDWQRLSTAPAPEVLISYFSVVKKVPIVGNRIADFILFLMAQGIIKGPQDVHLIGHSLGAHASGIAGQVILERTGKLIDRITGLDPARPLYDMAKPDAKLDSEDAEFVDILHTAIGLGTGNILGHVDFFPNGGGPTDQPDCFRVDWTDPSSFFEAALFIVCSHSISVRYYGRSIRRTQPELYGCRCDYIDWTDYIFVSIKNECRIRDRMICEDRTLFGEYVPRTARGNFYINIDESNSVLRP